MLYPTTGSEELLGAIQDRSTSCGTAVPLPLSDTVFVPPVVELLLIVNVSVSVPEVVGLNCTVTVAV
jgi:hypothetical protein